ncbi:FecR family protein [uncultured Thalassospira sp.]|uniref:FecR family protein n=1 Tax=uncultured Thalassospira sp. TaxID=404382 RepID=UPI0030D73B53|tara:strand:- start:511 stop:1569 length:1059 start_codon:yes stop_codon:yes gene_type:complete
MSRKDDALAGEPRYEQISREATDWLIFLQDDPEDPELAARFDVWLSQSPHHAQAWAKTWMTANLMAHVEPFQARNPPVFEAKMQAQKAAFSQNPTPLGTIIANRSATKRRPVWKRFVVAGMAIAAMLVAAVIGPDVVTGIRADYTTGTGETRTVTLADGSRVVLAPETAIRVHYTPGARHVELLDGEAYFEVIHHRDQPFRVRSDAVNVTVLGTGFDVSDEVGSTFVAVAHGSVRVENESSVPAISEVLTPGQSTRIGWSGGVDRQNIDTGAIAMWRHNQLIAQDQPLGDVVHQLRRYYSGRIFVTDRGLAKRTVTGVYNLHDPVAALRGIARAQNAVVRQITPWLLIVSPS